MRVAPLLLLALSAAACVTPASYKMTVASMMGCNESEVTWSKPDMNDDHWLRGTGCGKTVDAICDQTGDNSTGGRCIAIPTKLDDLLRWHLAGAGCANPKIAVGPAFQSREDQREYDVTGCGGNVQTQKWKCSATSELRKRQSCEQILR